MTLIFLIIVLSKSKSSINSWLTDSKFQISKINSLKSDLIKFNQISRKRMFNKKKIFVEYNLYLD